MKTFLQFWYRCPLNRGTYLKDPSQVYYLCMYVQRKVPVQVTGPLVLSSATHTKKEKRGKSEENSKEATRAEQRKNTKHHVVVIHREGNAHSCTPGFGSGVGAALAMRSIGVQRWGTSSAMDLRRRRRPIALGGRRLGRLSAAPFYRVSC